MRHALRHPLARLVVGLLLAPLLAACGQAGAPASGTITVDAKDTSCTLSTTTAQAGKVVFDVTNNGSQVNEFYLYASDGKQIEGELENLGPGLSRTLTVSLPAGDYVTACRVNGVGDGIRAPFTVTGTAPAGTSDTAAIGQVQDEYAEWVREQSGVLVHRTNAFVRAYAAGKDDLARTLYPRARTPWESIETVAESFSDLDARTDTREADLAPGQRWTGWHRIEKDLWPPAGYQPLTPAQRRVLGADLESNVGRIHARIQHTEFTVAQIANGSAALMEEVATGKVTGEEEHWSRTDLYDFAGNVAGARKAFELLHPVVEQKDPELAETLATRFDALDGLLARHRAGAGFVGYDALSQDEVKTLADAVNALSEPLSELTAVVLG